MGESVQTREACVICRAREDERSAVTLDVDLRPVCADHAPQDYHDHQTIVRELTGFISWYDERAASFDSVVVKSRKETAKATNRALATAHRRAAGALRELVRKMVDEHRSREVRRARLR